MRRPVSLGYRGHCKCILSQPVIFLSPKSSPNRILFFANSFITRNENIDTHVYDKQTTISFFCKYKHKHNFCFFFFSRGSKGEIEVAQIVLRIYYFYASSRYIVVVMVVVDIIVNIFVVVVVTSSWSMSTPSSSSLSSSNASSSLPSSSASSCKPSPSSHYGTKPGHFETSKIHCPTSEGVSKVSERANE